MGYEIERKFLVDPSKLPDLSLYKAKFVRQGYLSENPAIRVRVSRPHGQQHFDKAKMTVKGPGTLVRQEIEFSIQLHDGFKLLDLCDFEIEKHRYSGIVVGDGYRFGEEWVLDYIPALDLWLAEIEFPVASGVDLAMQETTVRVKPDFVTTEVTEDPNYTNLALAKKLAANEAK